MYTRKDYLRRKEKLKDPEYRKKYNAKKLALYYKHHEAYKKASLLRYKKMRLLILEHYGGIPPKCECCGETKYEFLTIDHVNGGGIKHRKSLKNQPYMLYRWLIKNKFPGGFRILCMNCNHAIGHYQVCPHKRQ